MMAYKQRLQLREEELTGMYDLVDQHITDAIFRCNFEGKITYANKAFMKSFGYSSQMKIGNLEKVPFYVDKKILKLITSRLFSPKAKYVGEVEFSKKGGEKFYGQLSTIRFESPTGEIHFDGIIRDMSLQRKYSLELRHQEKIQKKLLQISSQFINADASQAALAIVQALQELGTFLHADRVQIHEYEFASNVCLHSYAWHKKGIPTGANKEINLGKIQEIVQLHLKGEPLIVNDVSSLPDGFLKETVIDQKLKGAILVPMFLKNDLIGFISMEYLRKKAEAQSDKVIDTLRLFANMVANLSNRSKDQLKLQSLLEKMSIQNKRLTDFSFVISHHIRASTANLTSLKEFLTTDFPQNEYLQMMGSAVDKLNQGVTNINQILHADQEYLLTKQPVKVVDSLDKVLHALAHSIQSRGIKILNEIPKNLYVNAIGSHLDNILFQLISNAIRYGTDEQNKVVKLTAENCGGFTQISIVDFGAGLDIDRHGKDIFRAGARFHSTYCDGMGMGLFISKLQVEALGGNISLHSSVGHGTRVTVAFPHI